MAECQGSEPGMRKPDPVCQLSIGASADAGRNAKSEVQTSEASYTWLIMRRAESACSRP